MKKFNIDTAAPEARSEVLRLEQVQSQLLAMLRRIVDAWESVPEDVQVPDEINENQMWEDANELLDSLEA